MSKLPEDLREKVAKWLFTNKSRFPNARFYAGWYDEIRACPLTGQEYLKLADQLSALYEAYYLGMIEEARKEGRDYVIKSLEMRECTGHSMTGFRRFQVHEGAWQALKESS